jgi:NAD(P)-dependent dehydrogenase (short-subunit alcohol dehydrogenase family)
MARILITGATAGIGRVTALHLAGRGHDVFASGRRREALESLEKEGGGRLRGLAFDVTDPAAITAAREEIDRQTSGSGLDVLVNNAGYGQGGPLEQLGDAELRAQYDTNVFGLMAVTRAFLPAMRARGAGRIVNVGSVAGTLALPFLGAYASTKHALQGLTDALRRELRPHGIQVCLIRPGAIRTGFGQGEAVGLERYAAEGEPYARQLRAFRRWHATLHPRAPEPITVARAIEHAAVAPRPRAVYVVPASSWGLIWMQRLVPTRWADRLIERVTGLDRA